MAEDLKRIGHNIPGIPRPDKAPVHTLAGAAHHWAAEAKSAKRTRAAWGAVGLLLGWLAGFGSGLAIGLL